MRPTRRSNKMPSRRGATLGGRVRSHTDTNRYHNGREQARVLSHFARELREAEDGRLWASFEKSLPVEHRTTEEMRNRIASEIKAAALRRGRSRTGVLSDRSFRSLQSRRVRQESESLANGAQTQIAPEGIKHEHNHNLVSQQHATSQSQDPPPPVPTPNFAQKDTTVSEASDLLKRDFGSTAPPPNARMSTSTANPNETAVAGQARQEGLYIYDRPITPNSPSGRPQTPVPPERPLPPAPPMVKQPQTPPPSPESASTFTRPRVPPPPPGPAPMLNRPQPPQIKVTPQRALQALRQVESLL
ncbi:hypothetical protein GGR57DRAFT_476601 [Xylariaceae sp. FL1272]|nr:hypothetical protein GGR57DRAFT_476601 [Xylariaceae sp. FL1272]